MISHNAHVRFALSVGLLLMSLAPPAVSKTYHVPPNIIGLPQDSAVKLVTDSGFTDVKMKDTFGVGAVGTVAATYPKNSYQAPAMTIWIWRGAPPDSSDTLSVKVPSVKWLHWPAAQDTLRKLGLKWIAANVTTSGDSVGRVLAQDPDLGETLNRGDTVKCDVGVKAGVKLDATKLLLTGLIVVAVVAILLLLFRPRRPEPAQSYAMPSGKGHGRNKGRPVSPGDSGDDAGFRPAEAQTLRKVAGDWDYQTRFWASEFKKLRDNVAQLEERLEKLSRDDAISKRTQESGARDDRKTSHGESDPVAKTHEPEHKDVVTVYNNALDAGDHTVFTGQFRVTRVGPSQRSGDGMTEEVGVKPKLTEDGTGMFWLVFDSGRTVVFPMQPLERSDQYAMIDVQQIFESRKVSGGRADRLVKRVAQPATCREISSGVWQLERKGELEVFDK